MSAAPHLGLLCVEADKHNQFLRAACDELKWPYTEIDFWSPHWLDDVQKHDPHLDLYAIWPMPSGIARSMMETRLGILAQVTRKPLCPPLRDLWFHENKERQYFWLRLKGIDVPETRVIYRYADRGAARELGFPLVAKTLTGACGGGVHLLADEAELEAYTRIAFREGVPLEPMDPPAMPSWQKPLMSLRSRLCRLLHSLENERLYAERQKNGLFLQKYLPRCREWRVTTIRDRKAGHLYMWGYEKTVKEGDWKKSGSNLANWTDPPPQAKQIALQIQAAHDFDSMAVDVLECLDTGRFYANEFHVCWGWLARGQLQIDGVAGRWVYNAAGESPRFERGEWGVDAERLRCFWNGAGDGPRKAGEES